MHGKSSLADGINHQNTHISKHLFAHKTSSTSIELDVDDKRKPMRKRPEEQIEIEEAKSTPTALFFPRGFLTRQSGRSLAIDQSGAEIALFFPQGFLTRQLDSPQAIAQTDAQAANRRQDAQAGHIAQIQDAQAGRRPQARCAGTG